MQLRGRTVGTGEGGLSGSSITSSMPSQLPSEVRPPSCPPPTAPVSLLSFNFILIPVMSVLLCLFQETRNFWQTGHVLPGHHE